MRVVRTFILVLAAAAISFGTDHDPRPDVSEDVFNWENLEVLSTNREEPHAQIHPFPSDSAALHLDRSDSPGVLSLDGTWKFYWVPKPADRPLDFFEPGYDDDSWDEIEQQITFPVERSIAGLPDLDGVRGTLVELDALEQMIQSQIIKVGGRQRDVDWTESVLMQRDTQLRAKLSLERDADIAQVSADLAAAEMSYQSSLLVTSKLFQANLMMYL